MLSGGGYSDTWTTYQSFVCLQVGQEYQITVKDSTGDGILPSGTSFVTGFHIYWEGEQIFATQPNEWYLSIVEVFVAASLTSSPTSSPYPTATPTIFLSPAQLPSSESPSENFLPTPPSTTPFVENGNQLPSSNTGKNHGGIWILQGILLLLSSSSTLLALCIR